MSFQSAAVCLEASTRDRRWQIEHRSWTRVAPSSLEVAAGVVFDAPDEHAVTKMIAVNKVKTMGIHRFFIFPP